jgi:hypothetical protein
MAESVMAGLDPAIYGLLARRASHGGLRREAPSRALYRSPRGLRFAQPTLRLLTVTKKAGAQNPSILAFEIIVAK